MNLVINNINQSTFCGNKLNTAVSTAKLFGESNFNKTMSELDILSNLNSSLVKKIRPIDVPIKTEAEFDLLWDRILKAKTINGNSLWINEGSLKKYPKANKIQRGLLPYCGENDSSCLINMYLSGRIEDERIQKSWKGLLPADKMTCIDIVRVLDYSLKNLDNEVGKYKGIVYRQGFMDKNTEQYWSTSKNPMIAGQIHGNWEYFNPRAGFSVIRTKNGHNIYEFQKKMGNNFAKTEEEILIPRKTKFVEIPLTEQDRELLIARNKMASNLFAGADRIVSGQVREFNGYTKQNLFSMIKVFDEV